MKKTNLEANDAFLQYEEEIVSNQAYDGMPDLRHEDGSIQWEAPSNRGAGEFQFSHDKRYQWWVQKAAEIGISTDEDKWISKVAKRIHPTKLHPCKVCGRIMDIRYCYLSANFIKRVQKLPFYDGAIEMSEITHILDFISAFVDIYGGSAYAALPGLLKCSQVKQFPQLPNDLSAWNSWIAENYIPKEPSMLGPGAMSNPPDRLDGFHTYNRCCRHKADKGRSKENLASYSTDRRAFENWSDGNWITANKLMGYINSNADMKQQHCANDGNGQKHPRPCSADHIGPISLGFYHRPEFQLLCTPCNSAKNNRMYFSDVQHLINIEQSDIEIVTVDFSQKTSTLKYVNIQKTRKIRVAFSALDEYSKKENRNGYVYTNTQIEDLKSEALKLLKSTDSFHAELNQQLISALSEDAPENAIDSFLSKIDYNSISSYPIFTQVKNLLKQVMTLVAAELASKWDDPRYAREIDD